MDIIRKDSNMWSGPLGKVKTETHCFDPKRYIKSFRAMRYRQSPAVREIISTKWRGCEKYVSLKRLIQSSHPHSCLKIDRMVPGVFEAIITTFTQLKSLPSVPYSAWTTV